jgi:hypothetical protein
MYNRNINLLRSICSAMALGAMLLPHKVSLAQALYYPNNATINSALVVSGEPAWVVVGYASNNDFLHGTNRTSPTVGIVSGANIDGLSACNRSTVNISGGTVEYGAYANDTSTVNMSGGTVENGVYAEDTSTVNISGGHFDSFPQIETDGGTINLSGGSAVGLVATNNGTINAYHGSSMSGATIAGGATVNIHGGTVIAGSQFSVGLAYDEGSLETITGPATLNVYGVPAHWVYISKTRAGNPPFPLPVWVPASLTATKIALVPGGDGPLGFSYGYTEYALVGSFSDGTPVNTKVLVYSGGVLNVH